MTRQEAIAIKFEKEFKKLGTPNKADSLTKFCQSLAEVFAKTWDSGWQPITIQLGDNGVKIYHPLKYSPIVNVLSNNASKTPIILDITDTYVEVNLSGGPGLTDKVRIICS